MSAFESKDDFVEFVRTVRSDRRFIFDGKAGNFLTALRAGSKSRAYRIQPRKRLFRAQIGSQFGIRPGDEDAGVEEETPLPKFRMTPDPKYIKHGGRANPPGFAYLYLATDERTALAEMRPWVEESLTLGIFEIKRKLKIVDCRAGKDNWGEVLFKKKPSAKAIDTFVWNQISRAFARPVNQEDRESSYLPTQILAEAFKAEGFAGVAYQSGLERGINVVLFDASVAELVHRFVYTLKRVRYTFEAAPNLAIWREKNGKGEGIYEISTESP